MDRFDWRKSTGPTALHGRTSRITAGLVLRRSEHALGIGPSWRSSESRVAQVFADVPNLRAGRTLVSPVLGVPGGGAPARARLVAGPVGGDGV
ncbi:MAG: hypothetical protein EON54_00370 [Alcaligenaceae bacterium]|nr:MAG: hypothetical protein EON54_00370 [Alcaligenaceae bacterium]